MRTLKGCAVALTVFSTPGFASAFVETERGRFSAELNGAKIRLQKGRVTFGRMQMHFAGKARAVQPVAIGAKTMPVSEVSEGAKQSIARVIRFCDRVRYKQIWAGIDVEFYLADGDLRYEFLFEPGAPVENVALSFRGAEGLEVRPDGSIRVTARDRHILTNTPVSWEEHMHTRRRISTRYVAAGRRTVVLVREEVSSVPNGFEPATASTSL
jgi:hypothetical protein